MLTGYDFNRIDLSLPNASLIFRYAERKKKLFFRLAGLFTVRWHEGDCRTVKRKRWNVKSNRPTHSVSPYS